MRDLIAHSADKVRDGREVGCPVPAQHGEHHVIPTCRRDAAAPDDPMRVRDEDHLQEHRRRAGGCVSGVVANARDEAGEVDGMLEQAMHRVLEQAGKMLPRQIDGQELWIGVDVLVTDHRRTQQRRATGARQR